jgi:hypothetical protein
VVALRVVCPGVAAEADNIDGRSASALGRCSEREGDKDALLPDVVSAETEYGEEDQAKVEWSVTPEPGDDAGVLSRDARQGGNERVEREEGHGEEERSRNGCERGRMVSIQRQTSQEVHSPAREYLVQRLQCGKELSKFNPTQEGAKKYLLRDQRCLAKNSEKYGQVKCRSPHPVTAVGTVRGDQTSPENAEREDKQELPGLEMSEGPWIGAGTDVETHQTVIERVDDPEPECLGREEVVLLAELVQLGVPIEHSCADELVEDSDDERGQEGEDDVVERERPRLVGDLTREVVDERVL